MRHTLLFFFICFSLSGYSQTAHDTDLYQTLQAKDSLLFNIGFNECNIEQFDALLHTDYKMYHDQSGVVPDRRVMLTGLREGLCKMDYKASRKLKKESLEVFPLQQNGELYGAIQMGEHAFYAKYPDKDIVLTSTAKFTHLWLLEDGAWKLAHVLSYDHQVP